MMRQLIFFLSFALSWSGVASAQDDLRRTEGPGLGVDFSVSTDGDKTNVVKIAGKGLVSYDGPDRYVGLAYERAWYSPLGQSAREKDRVYLEAADAVGDWRWHLRMGSDGDTVLGSANIRTADWSKEFFVERDLVESPRGVDEGLYYTFVGASADVALGEKDVLTVMTGAQEFTGKNVRLHLRGNYIHLLRSDWGLSIMAGGRYYHSTRPGEYDYYSPRNYIQLLPAIQLRRFSGGWEYRLRGGWGAEKSTNAKWRQSRYGSVHLASPRHQTGWHLIADVVYTEEPPVSGYGTYYLLGSIGFARRF